MIKENKSIQTNNDVNIVEYQIEEIKQKIFIIRGKQVMLDSDVAERYQYTTKNINKAMKRNINRFPEKFRLIKEDVEKVDDKGRIDASDSEGSGGGLSFSVRAGQSILENVYGAYQTLKLKEDIEKYDGMSEDYVLLMNSPETVSQMGYKKGRKKSKTSVLL